MTDKDTLQDMLSAVDRKALADQTIAALAAMSAKCGPGEAVAVLAVVQADMLGKAIATLLSTGVVKPGYGQTLVDSLLNLHDTIIKQCIKDYTFHGATAGNA